MTDADNFWRLIGCWQVWAECALAFGIGCIGALAHIPPPPSTLGDTDGRARSILTRVLVGGIAAVAILFAAAPTTGVALISGSLIAGYGGLAILAALESRVEAGLARKDAAERRRDLEAALRVAEDPQAEQLASQSREILAGLRAKYSLLPPR